MDIIEALKLTLDWPFVTLVAIILAFILGRNIIQKKANSQSPSYWFFLLLIVAILLFIGGWIALKRISSSLSDLSNLVMGAATIAVAVFTFFVHRATQLQFVANMIAAFQNEWHSIHAILMRDYLHSVNFKKALNDGIEKAYGTKITYEEITKLLQDPEPDAPEKKQKRLEEFEAHLRSTPCPDDLDPTKLLFSAYQAANVVLISFDRLAVIRDMPLMKKKFISRYSPPIRDLSPVLQAFIAVRITLRQDKDKNYKKDYMHLLGSLDFADPILFKRCYDGLIDREKKGLEKFPTKEKRDWQRIVKRLSGSRKLHST